MLAGNPTLWMHTLGLGVPPYMNQLSVHKGTSKEMRTTGRRSRAFRVENIPHGTTLNQVQHLFEEDDRPNIHTKSIAPAIDNHTHDGDLTAVITYQPPRSAQDESCQAEPRLLERSNKNHVETKPNFLGFTPLYQPPGDIVADVIAVTGLAEHPYGSWATSDGTMWLQDYIPKDIPDVRVLIYGYDSDLKDRKARAIIGNHGGNFRNKLLRMRKLGKCEDRPLILIGHGLGGLIVKETLIDRHLRRLSLPVRTIIFFGTPHRGLQTDALRTLVGSTPSKTIVEELTEDSTTLFYLNRDFRHVVEEVDILSIYEMYPTKTVLKVR